MAALSEEAGSAPAHRTWADFKTKQTEAKPKHTLFGSNIEMADERDKEALRELDVREFQANVDRQRKLKQDRYKVKVPDYLRKSSKDKPLEHTSEEIKKQLEQTQRARQLMDLLEEKSKYFQLDIKPRPANPEHTKSGQWIGDKDIHQANDISALGISESYNHDRYMTKPRTHRYSHAGDPLRLGLDCPEPQTVATQRRPFYRVERHGPPDRMPRDFYMKQDPVEEDDPCAVHLPPNIKHQFGTKVCNHLLSDAGKVEDTIRDQKKQKGLSAAQSRSAKRFPRLPAEEDSQSPAYKSLGDALRYDFFPGYTCNHRQSLAHSVYTEDVHKQRVPVPDKYRYQRDELSKWAEHNVLRDRVKKAWDTYLADTLPAK